MNHLDYLDLTILMVNHLNKLSVGANYGLVLVLLIVYVGNLHRTVNVHYL